MNLRELMEYIADIPQAQSKSKIPFNSTQWAIYVKPKPGAEHISEDDEYTLGSTYLRGKSAEGWDGWFYVIGCIELRRLALESFPRTPLAKALYNQMKEEVTRGKEENSTGS